MEPVSLAWALLSLKLRVSGATWLCVQEPEGEEQQAALQENWFALIPSRRIYGMPPTPGLLTCGLSPP